jgi:O-antigen ligase
MKGIWKFGVIAFIAYILLFPVVWQLFPFSQWEWIPDKIFGRILLFETASNAIKNQWFLGYGFGSTLSLQIADYLPEAISSTTSFSLYSDEYNGLFPGAHPHNLIALIWLDFGLIGAMLFTFFIYRFYRWLLPIMNDREIAPFIIALIVSAVVIFSFSFSIWQTDVVLTYAMFFACLMSVLSKKHHMLWSCTSSETKHKSIIS